MQVCVCVCELVRQFVGFHLAKTTIVKSFLFSFLGNVFRCNLVEALKDKYVVEFSDVVYKPAWL